MLHLPQRARSIALTTIAFASLCVGAGCNGAKPREGRDTVADPGAVRATSTSDASAHDTSPPAAASSAEVALATASASATAAPASPPPAPVEPGDRIYAKARHVWILPAPRPSHGWLGYLTIGGSVRLYQGSAEKAKTLGPGCDAYYRVEPMGYVCAGDEATIDPNDPTFRALAADAADVGSPYPYRYAESLGTPRYVTVPTLDEQRKAEWDLDRHEAKLAELKAGLASGDLSKVDKAYVGVDLSPAGVEAPTLFPFGALVREARDYVAPTSTVAFSRAFDEAGRTWLVTSDHVLVPKDRTRPYPTTTFHGVHLDATTHLPIAFARRHDAVVYRAAGEGAFEPTSDKLTRLAWVMLTDHTATSKGKTYVETKAGAWLDANDVAIAAENKDIPYHGGEKIDGRRTWLDISVLGGTLVAYEGSEPVFATLVSPGRGGIPFPDRDPLSTASTPTGTFRIDGKFKTATMISSTDSNIVHAEVQWVQNFHGPHALHGAYWHDGWGELKSGGCVNLSPIDSKEMFEWTEPAVPKDWYGLRSVPELGPATRVVVRR